MPAPVGARPQGRSPRKRSPALRGRPRPVHSVRRPAPASARHFLSAGQGRELEASWQVLRLTVGGRRCRYRTRWSFPLRAFRSPCRRARVEQALTESSHFARMTRGVVLFLVGSGLLITLAACGRGWFEERAPWRHDAEVTCLRSGAVKEGPGIEALRPIDGPGICGADFPRRVSTLGTSAALGFADEPEPPGLIPPRTVRPPMVMSQPGA